MQEFVTSASYRHKRFFSSPKHPDWVPGVLLLWMNQSRSEAVTSLPTLRMTGAIPPTPVFLYIMHMDSFSFFVLVGTLLTLIFKQKIYLVIYITRRSSPDFYPHVVSKTLYFSYRTVTVLSIGKHFSTNSPVKQCGTTCINCRKIRLILSSVLH